MAKKMPIGQFVAELREAVDRKDGYIMGTKGQDPKKLNHWYFDQYADRDDYTEKQEKKALYWKEHAERVWDCNGLSEGLYEDYADVNINTKARYNYAQWCDPKGSGMIPTKYRVPGAAVFWSEDTASHIHHVAYLDKPVEANNPAGDWYIIEARGVLYGVVRTKLNNRKPNYWGWMTKYFDYGATQVSETKPGDRMLRNGCEGEDVKALQTNLIRLGYSCGRWGADGDFGDATEMAVEKFQRDHGLEIDGVYGPKSHNALEKAIVALNTPVESPTKVKIVGGDCWIRDTSNTKGARLGVAHDGDTYDYCGKTSENGWNQIVYKNTKAWVSGKYSEVVK